MTNFVKIHCMTVDKLAEFLHNSSDRICFDVCERNTGNAFECPYAKAENDDVTDFCLTCYKAWLESEYREVTSNEVKREGKSS